MTYTNLQPQLLRLIDVTRLTGLSKSTIYRHQDLGLFPKPVKLTARTVAWVAAEIDRWVQCRLAFRDNPTTGAQPG